MKKTGSIVLAIVLCLALLTGCGAKKPMDIIKSGYLSFDKTHTIDEMAQYVLVNEAATDAYYEDKVVEGKQYTNLYFILNDKGVSICLSFEHAENEQFSLYNVTTTDESGTIYELNDEDTIEIMQYLYSLIR